MRSLLAIGIVCVATAGAVAQTIGTAPGPDPNGKNAGDFMVRFRAIGVLPEASSSSVSAIGGSVDVTKTPAPELDLSYSSPITLPPRS
nr:hypothetical protein [uncultured Lichenicoccus sp.]